MSLTWQEKYSEILFVGRDIDWKDVVFQVFRILEFDRNGTYFNQNNQVIPIDSVSPYGFLKVETPLFEGSIIIPIVHKDDFVLASSVFDEVSLMDEIKSYNLDILTTYIPKDPKSGSIGIHHGLHFVITNNKAISEYYQTGKTTPENLRKLFVQFVWEGELIVQININPFS